MEFKKAKIRTQFLDVSDDMKLDINESDGNISIYVYNSGNPHLGRAIHLDVPTAIKLHKTLRTEINKAKGGQNVK